MNELNKIKMKVSYLVALIILVCISCKSQNMELEVVKEVDIKKYLGKWYEIARFPHSFEKNLKCVTAEYGMKKNGKISVLNKGYLKDNEGSYKLASGTAWVPDMIESGKLKVRFFWPFAGKYWIIDLDKKNYQYALVGDPSRKYLWILCRNKKMDENIYNQLVNKANEQGFNVSLLEKIAQNCE